MNDVLLYFSIKYKGDWENIFKALEEKEKIPIEEIFELKSNVINNYTTIIDKEYPSSLKRVYKAPFLFFHFGNLLLLNKKLISIFGNWNIEDLLKILENNKDVCFIINFESKNAKLIQNLKKHKIQFICITNDGINNNDFKDIMENNNHNLFLSEFYKKNLDNANDQLLSRISIGLSKKVLIKYKKLNIDVLTGLELGKIEDSQIYTYGKCDEDIIKKYNIIKINKISDIFSDRN